MPFLECLVGGEEFGCWGCWGGALLRYSPSGVLDTRAKLRPRRNKPYGYYFLLNLILSKVFGRLELIDFVCSLGIPKYR